MIQIKDRSEVPLGLLAVLCNSRTTQCDTLRHMYISLFNMKTQYASSN